MEITRKHSQHLLFPCILISDTNKKLVNIKYFGKGINNMTHFFSFSFKKKTNAPELQKTCVYGHDCWCRNHLHPNHLSLPSQYSRSAAAVVLTVSVESEK